MHGATAGTNVAYAALGSIPSLLLVSNEIWEAALKATVRIKSYGAQKAVPLIRSTLCH
jgi:hypothetical protein